MGNGGRFARDHGPRTRYCEAWGGYLVYDGTRWRRDHRREVDALAKETVRGIYGEAETCQDENMRKKLARWALQSESKTRLDALLFCARSEPGIPTEPDDFDADLRQLNVKNGTITLDSGELKPHDPRDHITKLDPVRFDPNAAAPTWEAFLARVLPSVDLRRFVQRAVGYALLGDTTEEVLFFLYGKGNGKPNRQAAALFLQISGFSSGAEGIRTPDLRRAKAALSQLSYGPGTKN
jgi:putative DNA primase/helicase